MRKIAKSLMYVMLAVLLCTGCSSSTESGSSGDATGTEQDQSTGILQEEGVDRDKYLEELISRTKAIEGADAFEGRYEEPMSFALTEKETEELLEALAETTVVDPTGGSTAYYKLIFRNEDGEVLDEWMVDAAGRFSTYCGRITDNKDDPDAVDPDSVLESWRTRMEAAHELSYEKVLSRKPGARYFDDLAQAKSADLSEITENNFIEGIEYDLSEDEMELIRGLAGKIQVKDGSRHTESDDLYYRISIYDEGEAELHTIDVEKDGTVSCNGWLIEGKELEAAVSSIYESSGLANKQ